MYPFPNYTTLNVYHQETLDRAVSADQHPEQPLAPESTTYIDYQPTVVRSLAHVLGKSFINFGSRLEHFAQQ